MEPCATLELAELERRPLRVALSPAPSLFALAADAAGARRGAPRVWLDRVRAELDQRDLATLSPLAVPPGAFTPASVMPRHGATEAELFEELDRIAELPAEALLDDIEFARGPDPNGAWATVARHPRRWLVRYAEVLRKAWRGVRGPWTEAGELFEREVRRVGAAGARGAAGEVLASIHPRARIRDGYWCIPDPDLTMLQGPGARPHADPDPGRLGLGRRRPARRRHPRLDHLPAGRGVGGPPARIRRPGSRR